MNEVKYFLDRYLFNSKFYDVSYTLNDSAYYVTANSSRGEKRIQDILEKMPDTMVHYVDLDGRHLFGSVSTLENEYNFEMAKVQAIGSKLLQHENETIKIMEEYKNVLLDFIEVKRMYNNG